MTEEQYLTNICKSIDALDTYRRSNHGLKDIDRGRPVIDTLLILEGLLDDLDKVKRDNDV